MRIPMVMHWPGVIPKGRVVREIGSHLDLLPTVAKAAGTDLPVDRTLDGFDVLPLVVSGARSPHDAIYWSLGGQLAVRRGDWKLVQNGKAYDGTPAGSQALTGEDAIFLSNLAEDPGESVNLRRKYPQVVDELMTVAQRWLIDVKKP